MTCPLDNRNRIVVLILLVLAVSGCTAKRTNAADPPLQKRTLLVRDEQVSRARELFTRDPEVSQVAAALKESADRLLNDPPVERKLTGPRLLSISKEAQRRIWLLAGMHRWTGETRYLDRAVIELRAVCNFSDWNPSHFLDVAEMCAAVAVGYDWLFDQLSPEDRTLIRQAIISKAMLPAIDAFEKKIWWTTTDINWAQVCSGGLAMGALAIRGEEPQLASKMLELANQCMSRPMNAYAPDGGYIEGAGYWNYGTRFSVLYFAALQSAQAEDSSLIHSPGFGKTGFFRIHTIGPSNKLFNYADCNEPVDSASHMFWLARQFNQPIFAQHERAYALAKPDILHLFWWNTDVADLSSVPTSAWFEKAGSICLRSGWSKDAMYVGVKAGRNNFAHSHLDLGTFVLDCDGERWAIDLGSDNYNLPGYFGEQRWTYYRLKTEGQNTLCFDGGNQSPKGTASVARFDPHGQRITLDLSNAGDAYAGVKRSFELDGRGMVMRDQVTVDSNHRPAWLMHTRAEVTLSADHREATLKQGGRQMIVRIETPSHEFKVNDVSLQPPHKSTAGVKRLSINFDASPELVVRFLRN